MRKKPERGEKLRENENQEFLPGSLILKPHNGEKKVET